MISRAAAIEHVIGPLDMFEPHPENPRVMDATARCALAASVDRFGLVQPIVANRRTGRVVGGHQRLEMLRERGEVETEWWVGDWSEAEERALMVQLNDPASQGRFDEVRLASVIASVRAELPELVRELLPNRTVQLDRASDAVQGAEPFTAEEIVEDAIAWFRAHGFPYPSPCVHVAKQAINALSRSDELATTETATRIADMWCPHRYDKRAAKMKTVVEAFNDDGLLRRALAFRIETGKVDTYCPYTLNIVPGTQACANFRPGFAAHLYRRFCKPGDRVLDCSHGFGGRLVGFLAARVPEHYVGIDPCMQTSEGVGRMARDLGVAKRVTLIRKPAEDVTPDEIGQVQFAFTSPPYWDRERYSDEPTNSCNRYQTTAAWREGFLRPMLALQFAGLVSGARAVVNIAALDQGDVPLDKWTIEEGEHAGFVLSHIEGFPLRGMPGSGHESGAIKNEPVIVFVRP